MNTSVRLATPEDSKTFAEWVAGNPNIKPEDALEISNHPTAVTFVIEQNGQPILFMPLWCLLNIGLLGFAPGASKAQKMGALETMLAVLKTFGAGFGITEAVFRTSAPDGYPVVEWAKSKGFERLKDAEYRKDLKA